jgi:hypothetical protein
MGGTHPIAGSADRRTVTESHCTMLGEPDGGPGLNWVTVKRQTPTEYQNDSPIRFLAISFQPCEVFR